MILDFASHLSYDNSLVIYISAGMMYEKRQQNGVDMSMEHDQSQNITAMKVDENVCYLQSNIIIIKSNLIRNNVSNVAN